MDERIVSWQAARERMVYRYLTALQEGDSDTVLDVLAKAEQDAVLEEMLWQIHEVNLQQELGYNELETAQTKVSGGPLAPTEEQFGQRDNRHRKSAPPKFRRVSRALQNLVAVIAVCGLVGGLLVVLAAHHTSDLGSAQSFGCFVSTPVPQVHGWLVSVAAVAENNVWAVGGQVESNISQNEGKIGVSATLIEHWNGQRWQIVPSPNVTGMSNVLVSVTAISATDVWAVGQTAKQYSGSIAQTLTEHWNGQSWQIVPSKNLIQQAQNTLTGIAAVAANDIWAVGIVNQASPLPGEPHNRALIEHWNGQSWQIVSAPSPESGAIGSSLFSVVAISRNNVWAAGSEGAKLSIEHWNGQEWKSVASPALPGSLTAISAVGANDIWAVGNAGTIEHWDGHNWRLVANTPQHVLNAVLALAPNDVWAVGSAHNDPTNYETLVEHWDGKSWSVIASPDPGPSKQHANDLNGIAATSTGKIWIVGFQQVSKQTQRPLIAVSSCL